jgi:hypothetical protein
MAVSERAVRAQKWALLFEKLVTRRRMEEKLKVKSPSDEFTVEIEEKKSKNL